MVPVAEISDPKNDYNLNLPRYIDSTEPDDIQDINGHLRGGIPRRDVDALARYWEIMPTLRTTLFNPSTQDGYYELTVPEVKSAIFSHPEFTAFRAGIDRIVADWRAAVTPILMGFAADEPSSHPKVLIEALSEGLLEAFAGAPLLDAYDIYQHLMNYWVEQMQDDCYLIAADGWVSAAKPQIIIDDKSKKTKEKPDFAVGKTKYKAELIPSALIVTRYFATQQVAIEQLEAVITKLEQKMEELAEEHGGEGGLLEDARNERDKLTKVSVAARLKAIKGDSDAADERKLLAEFLAHCSDEATASAKLKAAQESLMEQVIQQYAKLTEDDVKSLVVEDKWLANLGRGVQGELERVSQTLTGRIRQLAERYATPLPRLVDEVGRIAAIVDKHIADMGVEWR
jgi:type I restriction enzyme M protein